MGSTRGEPEVYQAAEVQERYYYCFLEVWSRIFIVLSFFLVETDAGTNRNSGNPVCLWQSLYISLQIRSSVFFMMRNSTFLFLFVEVPRLSMCLLCVFFFFDVSHQGFLRK